MAWVVDTCLLIDVAEADPLFGIPSAQLLDRLRPDGLILCPMSHVELAPLFAGEEAAQNQFLHHLTVSWQEPWTDADTREAGVAWNRHILARRTAPLPKRPLADVLIGAFAMRYQGILTRNEVDFHRLFPALKVIVP